MPSFLTKLLLIGFLAGCMASLAGCPRSTGAPIPGNDTSPDSFSPDPSGTIRISGAWALYPLVVRWAEEYSGLYPAVRIDVSAGGAGKGATDALGGMVDIGMVSREIKPEEIAKGGWFVSVARDAVFAIANEENPLLAQLQARGMTRDTFAGIWITGKVSTWGQALGTDDTEPISVYTRSDACGAAETWAKFLGGQQEDVRGTGVYGDPGLTEAIRKDPLGIGYANLNYAYDPHNGRPIAGICIVPLDVDGNGTLDAQEGFYATSDQVVQALGKGRYPSPPVRDLHFLCRGAPEGLTRDFIKWALTDGQQYVLEAGFVPLAPETLGTAVDKLGP